MNLTHRDLERLVLDKYNAIPGCFAFPTHGPKNRPVYPGVFDVIVCYDGHFWAIEIKVGRDKMRPDQIKFASRVQRANGVMKVVESIDDV